MAGDGCEFGLFFSTTPQDLIQDGLYKALALASYPPPFNHVSSCLVACALGAEDIKSTAETSRHSRWLGRSGATTSGGEAPGCLPTH